MSYYDFDYQKSRCGCKPPFYPGPKPHPRPRPCPPPAQTHTHEFLGSTQLAGEICHNHRFAGVSSEEIKRGRSHTHAVLVNSDFFLNHYHEVAAESGPAIPVGEGRHVHFVCGETTFNAGHDHGFIFAMLIEDPISNEKRKDDYDDYDDYDYDEYDDDRDRDKDRRDDRDGENRAE
ncbi:MAG: hypothetical protein GX382_07230 [Syntrophomonadaceae bacterium]|nr:hypothetical protein [Syntrophomonadaceae bacterium]